MVESIEAQDRRLFERFSARFPTKFKDAREGFGITISLKDASAQGLRLRTMERVYLNDNINLEVKLPDGPLPVHLRGRVVWVRPIGEKLWEAGVQFHRINLPQIGRFYKFVSASSSQA
ncbi:MAG: PilZ domain-containing protein [Candidatus Omnitrophica bacterium]|nr:PilZ domain-containing protein [Candidatus Omnitrophota bacterium]